MSADTPHAGQTVGIAPWLPWPLSASAAWTEPVRAERLAVFRIGVAACLIFDVAYNYAPETLAYFGKDGLCDPTTFAWRFQGPRATWSLLRGVGDGATQYLALSCWIALTLWILGTSFLRLLFVHKNPPAQDRTGVAIFLWIFAFVWYSASLWSQMIAAKDISHLAWVVPLLGFSASCLFNTLDVATRLRDPDHHIPWMKLLFAMLTSMACVVVGYLLWEFLDVQNLVVDTDNLDETAWWLRALRSWQEDKLLLVMSMSAWIGCGVLLLLGYATRFAAIATWFLSMSFASANPYLDNAGDTIRLILLFYLMLCPCGAAWSIDALFRRRTGPVYVYPWPICLLFAQMIFMYWMNGLYKLFGETWTKEGTSLYYVMGDVVLTRFSQKSVPLSQEVYLQITQMMTWSILAWEVSFPLLVIFKWPRRFALFAGVMFHLGIFASMELGGFVPYALCMYLPFLPWGEFSRSPRPSEPPPL
ncbi:MAG: hypothetical protein EXR98_11455 [Gemmataceae bacterium]|nr:hypothetical protein [Gemmataceae bacterium]